MTELKTLIDSLRQLPQIDYTITQLEMVFRELDKILVRERILCKEKAKTRWLLEGDSNTHFFHISTINHRRYNYISYIFYEPTGCISNSNLTCQCFVNFYINLFASEEHCFLLIYRA